MTQEGFRIDAASSTVIVHVGRTGLLAFAGHDHDVMVPVSEGSVFLDRTDVSQSSIRLRFDATALQLTGKKRREDAKVRRVILSDRVLDVRRHPAITVVSRSISLVNGSRERVRLRVDAEFTIRGITRTLTIPLEALLSVDSMIATGSATVSQTAFEIRPVTVAAGMIKVKDDLTITFTLVARRP